MARRGSRKANPSAPRTDSGAESAPVESQPPETEANVRPFWRRGPWPILAAFIILETVVIAICYPEWRLDTNHRQAREFARSGDYGEAIARFRVLLDNYPDSPSLNQELGRVHFDAGHYAEALKCFSRAAANMLSPTVEMNSKMGRCLMELGDEEGALQRFRQALKSDPSEPYACYYLGMDEIKKGQYLKATEFLERVPFDAKIHDEARQRLQEIEEIVFADIPTSKTMSAER